MIAGEAPSLVRTNCQRLWRSVRPSLLDLRFNGDAWVAEDEDGDVSLCLGGYCLVRLEVLPFDVPYLNRTLLDLRHARARADAARRAQA